MVSRQEVQQNMIKVEIKCNGDGGTSWETVRLSRDDIEKLAIDKLRETNSSPKMQATSTTIEMLIPN